VEALGALPRQRTQFDMEMRERRSSLMSGPSFQVKETGDPEGRESPSGEIHGPRLRSHRAVTPGEVGCPPAHEEDQSVSQTGGRSSRSRGGEL
jgi:hypothetical protein